SNSTTAGVTARAFPPRTRTADQSITAITVEHVAGRNMLRTIKGSRESYSSSIRRPLAHILLSRHCSDSVRFDERLHLQKRRWQGIDPPWPRLLPECAVMTGRDNRSADFAQRAR